MSHAAIADRYARALFELGVETGQLDRFTQQLKAIAEVYSSSAELRHALNNPVIADKQRDGLLRELTGRLGTAPLLANALRLMAARRRLRALPDLVTRLTRLADGQLGVLRATVTSAEPLAEQYYEQIARVLGQKTQRTVVVDRQVDPSLIAGVITRVGDTVVDGSLKGRLRELERQLLSA
ncbi:MAG: ATP synthase F1 subunit delta [Polyangiaceae bacterium]|nr:ATP synthase F1 subunit delta [Polyangiaceae bacterium]